MATGFDDRRDSCLPPHLDSDAAKFYEVVDGADRGESADGGAGIDSCFISSGLDGPVRPLESTGPRRDRDPLLIDRARELKRRPDVAFVSAERWSLEAPVPRDGGLGRRPRPGGRGHQRVQLGERGCEEDRGVLSGRGASCLGDLSRRRARSTSTTRRRAFASCSSGTSSTAKTSSPGSAFLCRLCSSRKKKPKRQPIGALRR